MFKKLKKITNFFNVRIIKKTHIDSSSGCYSAKLEKLNSQTGQWVEKETESTFFPDEWDLNKLFHEFNYAFQNKVWMEGNKFHSKTTDNIKIEFIINQDDKILTCYPVLEKK